MKLFLYFTTMIVTILVCCTKKEISSVIIEFKENDQLFISSAITPDKEMLDPKQELAELNRFLSTETFQNESYTYNKNYDVILAIKISDKSGNQRVVYFYKIPQFFIDGKRYKLSDSQKLKLYPILKNLLIKYNLKSII